VAAGLNTELKPRLHAGHLLQPADPPGDRTLADPQLPGDRLIGEPGTEVAEQLPRLGAGPASGSLVMGTAIFQNTSKMPTSPASSGES
jgi:hypothetical protein